MILLYVLPLLGFLWLGIVSGREEGDTFTRMAWFLHKKAGKHLFLQSKRQEQKIRKLENELKSLHPGEPVSYHMTRYEVEKIRIALLVLFAGSILGILFEVKTYSEQKVSAEGYVSRGDFGEDVTELELYYQAAGEKEEILLRIPPRNLSAEELVEIEHIYREKLEERMLGENTSLEEVCNPLHLVSSIEGYPFSITWFSDDYEVIDYDGVIGKKVTEKTSVLLRAEVAYEDVNWMEEFTVTVFPKTQEELGEKIKDAVQNNMETTAEEKQFLLPDLVDGKRVVWKEKQSPLHYLLFPMILLSLGSILWGMDRDVVQKREERQRKLLDDYPLLLHKFTVYLGAGMQVKSIFLKLGMEYEELCNQKHVTNSGKDSLEPGVCKFLNRPTETEEDMPLGQELLLAVRELQAGKSEERVYTEFGKRTGLKEYKRFSTILVQTLKKGNDALVERLCSESEEALRDHFNLQKKKGEEAENSLLIPMILMLLVVMLMVLVPALISIQV